MLEFRSIEEPEIIEIHKHQNGDCNYEISDIFDNVPAWAPMTLEQVKEKIAENQKKPRTSIFSIWADDAFVGIGMWSSNWDPRGPWNHVIIWPEYRRKGYGTEAAKMLLDRTFLESPAHSIDTGAPDWSPSTITFIKSLGFREAGRMRMTGIKDGRYGDYLNFDILKNEYLDLKKEAG